MAGTWDEWSEGRTIRSLTVLGAIGPRKAAGMIEGGGGGGEAAEVGHEGRAVRGTNRPVLNSPGSNRYTEGGGDEWCVCVWGGGGREAGGGGGKVTRGEWS